MRLRDWIHQVHALHRKAARSGALDADEARRYREARGELKRLLLVAQRLALKPGEVVREALRVARALPVELQLSGAAVQSRTLDLSAGGFSTLLAAEPPAGATASFTLRLTAGQLRGRARPVSAVAEDGQVRASFSIEVLEGDGEELLAWELFDAALAEIEGGIDQD